MSLDTPDSALHALATFLVHPVTVTLLPEAFVAGSALAYKRWGEGVPFGRPAFWRLGGEFATGAVGLFLSAMLVFGAKAGAVLLSGKAEAQQFVRDFSVVAWVVFLVFASFFWGVMAADRKGRKKGLLRDPILPDVLGMGMLVATSWFLVYVTKRV